MKSFTRSFLLSLGLLLNVLLLCTPLNSQRAIEISLVHHKGYWVVKQLACTAPWHPVLTACRMYYPIRAKGACLLQNVLDSSLPSFYTCPLDSRLSLYLD